MRRLPTLGEALEQAERMAAEAGVVRAVSLAAAAPKEQPKPAPATWTPAKGKNPRKPNMNKMESRYAAHLEYRKQQGEILDWWREPVRFRIADLKTESEKIANRKDVFYKPDFSVQLNDYTVEFHETKGRMHRDALNHIKLAAKLHPFRFVVVTLAKGGGWEFEWYGGESDGVQG